MKKVIRLTENDLIRVISRLVEQKPSQTYNFNDAADQNPSVRVVKDGKGGDFEIRKDKTTGVYFIQRMINNKPTRVPVNFKSIKDADALVQYLVKLLINT